MAGPRERALSPLRTHRPIPSTLEDLTTFLAYRKTDEGGQTEAPPSLPPFPPPMQQSEVPEGSGGDGP
eukprot:3155730-Pleurochrysis_carterae.AAC.1